jgi:hypothetical protein
MPSSRISERTGRERTAYFPGPGSAPSLMPNEQRDATMRVARKEVIIVLIEQPSRIVDAAATRQGILIVGSKLLPTDVLHAARAYDEIFVLARAVPDPKNDLVVDEELARRGARERLAETTAWLRAHGARAVSGAVGDADFIAARRDAAALVPRGFFVQDA